jgi:hypothetical protein
MVPTRTSLVITAKAKKLRHVLFVSEQVKGINIKIS